MGLLLLLSTMPWGKFVDHHPYKLGVNRLIYIKMIHVIQQLVCLSDVFE
jgi:hypothetical protein